MPVEDDEQIQALSGELKSINEALWEIEDDIRDEERNKRFGDRFIELARAVYVTNDERANAKKKVNLHLNSSIVEENPIRITSKFRYPGCPYGC